MRMVFMAYLTDSIEAVDFYCRAFNTAAKRCFKASDEDDFYAHAEIDISDNIILSISDVSHYEKEFPEGRNMEFWLTFDDEKALKDAYEVLQDGAKIHQALAPCEWSKLVASVTDKYGVNWLLNVF